MGFKLKNQSRADQRAQATNSTFLSDPFFYKFNGQFIKKLRLSFLIGSMFIFLLLPLFLTSCKVGPNYERPPVEVPEHYKEAPPPGWKFAEPHDDFDRGHWWKIFHDAELDYLEMQIGISNQNVVAAEAQYRQALAIVDETRASYFPVIGIGGSAVVQKAPNTGGRGGGGVSGTTFAGISSSPRPFATYQVQVNATWVPDLWGSVRRAVESNIATAQASAAQLAAMELSMQGTLAQDYFQLRTLDADEKLLNNTVISYKKILKLTQQQYHVGTASLADVAQAVAQLQSAQANAIDIGVARSQFEHAIAVLIGKPPAAFAITFEPLTTISLSLPLEVPTALLERRPDIAAAERQIAAANALIGVAIAAYFPTLTLSGNQGFLNNHLQDLFTNPALFWSLGASVAQTIFSGGLRRARVAEARANYDSTVASYRQTVLSAFQNVEDNLAALRILESEATVQHEAVVAANTSLRLQLANFAAGTAAYIVVLQAQVSAYTNQQTAIDIAGRRMVAAAGLIMALGGGWDNCALSNVAKRVPLK